MQPFALALVLALVPACLDAAGPDEPAGVGQLEASIQIAGDGSFVPDTTTCARSIDEEQARYGYLGAPTYVDPGGRYRDYLAASIYLNPVYGCAFVVRYGMWEKWKGEGREQGVHGYPVSDELSSATGRSYQYFDKGSMWWRQENGVHELHGVIARKHFALGAAAGYPIADEVEQLFGLVAFANLDNDMTIYWTSLSGAWSVRGAIRTAYQTYPQKTWLGMPISDEDCVGTTCTSQFQWGVIRSSNGAVQIVPRTDGGLWEISNDTSGQKFRPAPGCSTTISQHWTKNLWLGAPVQSADQPIAGGGAFRDFQGGAIYLDPNSGCAFFLVNGFLATWRAQGGPTSAFGWPVSDELWTDPGRAHQFFTNGSMWWDPNLGLHAITGPIAIAHAARARAVGYPKGDVTYSNAWQLEAENNATIIIEGAGTTARVIHGPIRTVYKSLGGPGGELGLPRSEVICDLASGCHEVFDFGDIYWNQSTDATTVVRRNNWQAPLPPQIPPMPPPPVPTTVTSVAAQALHFQGPPGTQAGDVIYTTVFPQGSPLPDLKLLKIGYTPNLLVGELGLLKPGSDASACRNKGSSAMVMLNGGHGETTAAEMTALFGAATPAAPLAIRSCAFMQAGYPWPTQVFVTVTYSYTN